MEQIKMTLAELNGIFPVPRQYCEVGISGLANDSRKVNPGDLFFAIPGLKTNGCYYIKEAVQKGASAVITQIGAGTLAVCRGLAIPIIETEDIRRVQGLTAARFYSEPSGKLRLIGVTGTNGKTTVTHLVEHFLSWSGLTTGLIGTVWIDNGRSVRNSMRTTPDSLELQKILAEMAENGVKTAVMEASSHALSLKRLAGTEFSAAVLTNVTHDHYDFHRNYQNYLAAKLELFSGLKPGDNRYAVINCDDDSKARITATCRVPIFLYGSGPEADCRIRHIERKGFYSVLEGELFGRPVQLTTKLPGGFNIYNILAAVTVAYREGLDVETIEEALAKFPGVPGRYQEVDCGQPFRIMVDFAHNPAALENILQMAGENTQGKKIIVFGCEGEKDRLKRPAMGRIAAQKADIPILTADNIYHEDLKRIFEDVLKGLPDALRRRVLVEPDRRKAIAKAVQMADDGDFLIVAGKGHEQTLVKGEEMIRFNDVEVIKEILGEMTRNTD